MLKNLKVSGVPLGTVLRAAMVMTLTAGLVVIDVTKDLPPVA